MGARESLDFLDASTDVGKLLLLSWAVQLQLGGEGAGSIADGWGGEWWGPGRVGSELWAGTGVGLAAGSAAAGCSWGARARAVPGYRLSVLPGVPHTGEVEDELAEPAIRVW
ncbi:hypothetical protein HaLaN_29085, partial [Haematococcus lacustris]